MRHRRFTVRPSTLSAAAGLLLCFAWTAAPSTQDVIAPAQDAAPPAADAEAQPAQEGGEPQVQGDGAQLGETSSAVYEEIRANLAEHRDAGWMGEHWPQIIDEFLRLLEPRAATLQLFTPPCGEAARVRDFRIATDGMGKYWAEWTHTLPGDYNLDGQVTTWDLEWLGDSFGAAEGGEDWDTARFCDASGDGVVGLADVAPIAENYGQCVDRYEVVSSSYPPDIPGQAGRFEPYRWRIVLGQVEIYPVLQSAYANQADYRCELDMSRAQEYIWVEPVVTLHGAASLMHAEAGLRAQVAADPRGGPVPLEVTFDSYGTVGADYSAVVEWDFDGDGVFGEEEAEATAETYASYMTATLDGAYCRLAALRVTNEDGAQDTAVLPVAAYRTVPLAQLVPRPPLRDSFALIGGFPALACLVEAGDGAAQLWYVAAADAEAAHWGEPRLVCELPAVPAEGPLLADIAGRPALLYLPQPQGEGLGEAYFIGAADEAGTRWYPPLLAAAGLDPEGCLPALSEVDGRPALACTQGRQAEYGAEEPTQTVVYRQAADAAGQDWGEVVAVVAPKPPHVAYPVTLRLIGGRPALLLEGYNLYGMAVHYVRAEDALGARWGVLRLLEQGYTGNLGGTHLASGLFELGGAAACLLEHGTGNPAQRRWYFVLKCDTGESFEPVGLKQLPKDVECPYFATGSDTVLGTGESISVLQLSDPADGHVVVVLVSQRAATDGTRLRAALNHGGEVWQMTPEFSLGGTPRAASLRLLPDDGTGAAAAAGIAGTGAKGVGVDEVSVSGWSTWLQLYLGACGENGEPELRVTRIRVK